MKRTLFALLLVIAVLLAGCRETPESYTYEYNGKTLTVDTVEKTVTDGEDVYSYEQDIGSDSITLRITYPNGKTMTVHQNQESGFGNSSGGLNAEEASRYISEWTLLDALQNNRSEAAKFHFGYFLLGLILVGVGLWYLLSPETAMSWRYRLWIKDAEPTDFAIVMTRFGGVLDMICGVVLAILSFVQ